MNNVLKCCLTRHSNFYNGDICTVKMPVWWQALTVQIYQSLQLMVYYYMFKYTKPASKYLPLIYACHMSELVAETKLGLFCTISQCDLPGNLSKTHSK